MNMVFNTANDECGRINLIFQDSGFVSVKFFS